MAEVKTEIPSHSISNFYCEATKMADVKNEIPSHGNSINLTNGLTSSPAGSIAAAAAGSKKFKGIKVSCGELRKYLYAVEVYRQASMLRKGREVHKIYVNVHKGVSFLDDRFTLTEFGKMVLENGSVRAGRARNVRQIVVARETLYCSGTGGCKRACGGYGSCVSGCEKIKVRGHKCSFRVKLTMRLGYVDHWFVEILGSHNCYIEDGDVTCDIDKMLADYESKSSDGEDSGSSMQTSPPLSDTSSVGLGSQADVGFLVPNSSHSSILLTPAHCALNIPVFPESYLMTMARNAAAAVALTNQNTNSAMNGQHSPLSLSMKCERPDIPVPEMMNGIMHPSVINRFGFLHPSASVSVSGHQNGCSPSLPPTDVMDLSTPKVKMEDRAGDLSANIFPYHRDSALSRKNSAKLLKGEHYNSSKNNKTLLNSTDKNKSNTNSGCSIYNGQRTHILDNFSDFPNALLSSTPKTALTLSTSMAAHKLPSVVVQSAPSSPSSTIYKPRKYVLQKPRPSSAVDHPITVGENQPITPEAACLSGNQVEASQQPELRAASNCGENVEELDKDLINRVQQLEAHVTQLRNIVLKNGGTSAGDQKHKKQQREFDFTRYNTRHVALKIAYLGWDYHGFVVQEDSDRTIEAALFEALLKTRLIEARETSNYHRCGRTDKGVSAFGQVISIDLRTNLLTGVGVKVKEGGTACTRPGDTTTEIRYVHILNKVLPPEIRVLAWAPVDTDFSARFSCKKRTYKYFFPKANLDIKRMNEAAARLIGEHDFRNLCKMDVGNGVINFMRRILRADVTVLTVGQDDRGYSMCELTVVGQAFLWHQIRCIVSVLFLVAQGKEDVTIIEDLLDVDKNPRKPQYTMASELPLVLFDCEFGDDLEWIYEADWHEENIKHLQQMWAQHTIQATMVKSMLGELDLAKVETDSDIAPWYELSAPLLQQSEWLIPGNKTRVYRPLFKRQMCESLEERMKYYNKRKKLADKEVAENSSAVS